jgi:hypothetical protein
MIRLSHLSPRALTNIMRWPWCGVGSLSFFIISAALWKGRAPFFYEESTRKNGAADETRVASFYYFIYQLYLNANTWASQQASHPEHRHAINQINYCTQPERAENQKKQRAHNMHHASALGVFVVCCGLKLFPSGFDNSKISPCTQQWWKSHSN